MKSLAEMSLWLVPAVLMYLAYVLFRRLGTNRRSLERLFTEPADLAERPDGDSVVGGFLRRWLFLAGYRQPAASAVFVTAMLLAIGMGLATAFAIRGAGLTDELFRNIARLPPGVGDLLVPIAYLAPWTVFLILVLVPWLVVRRSRRQRVEAGGAGFAHLLGIAGHAQRSWSRLRCCLVACPRFSDGGSPFGPRVPHLSVGPLGGQNPRGIAAAIGPPLGSLVRNDPRLGIGSGGTVGQWHRPSTSPAGRRSARSSPRTSECVCHGAAHQADVSAW